MLLKTAASIAEIVYIFNYMWHIDSVFETGVKAFQLTVLYFVMKMCQQLLLLPEPKVGTLQNTIIS